MLEKADLAEQNNQRRCDLCPKRIIENSRLKRVASICGSCAPIKAISTNWRKNILRKLEDKYLGRATSLEKGHGRIDEREILTSFRIAGEIEFPFFEQVFRITRRSEEVKTGKVRTNDLWNYISVGRRVFRAKNY